MRPLLLFSFFVSRRKLVHSRFDIFPKSRPVYAVAFGLPLNDLSLFSCFSFLSWFFNWLRLCLAGFYTLFRGNKYPATFAQDLHCSCRRQTVESGLVIRLHSGECSYHLLSSGSAWLETGKGDLTLVHHFVKSKPPRYFRRISLAGYIFPPTTVPQTLMSRIFSLATK